MTRWEWLKCIPYFIIYWCTNAGIVNTIRFIANWKVLRKKTNDSFVDASLRTCEPTDDAEAHETLTTKPHVGGGDTRTHTTANTFLWIYVWLGIGAHENKLNGNEITINMHNSLVQSEVRDAGVFFSTGYKWKWKYKLSICRDDATLFVLFCLCPVRTCRSHKMASATQDMDDTSGAAAHTA